jgi:transcriptional regulator with XRE-family HTH domain
MAGQHLNYRSSAVGQVIREHRKARGLTQKQLAGELGVEARTLRMYENGERVLENISDLRRIADLLEINPVELGLAAARQHISTVEQIQDVVEQVAVLLPQACFIEARSTIDTLFRNVLRSVDNEDQAFLRILAHAHCLAGQIHAITRRTREVDHVLQHFQEMARIARVLDDQTLLNIALSYQGDMLRRRGEKAQAIALFELARECTPLADAAARGHNALLLGRAYASNEDYAGFEREIACAEELAGDPQTLPASLLLLYTKGSVYSECVAVYAKMGKREKSRLALERAEACLPANNLWGMLLKADRAEMLIYHGDILQAMPLLIEVAHLAQMYGHQRLVERLYRLQYYLDDQALLLRQASRNLGEILQGTIER